MGSEELEIFQNKLFFTVEHFASKKPFYFQVYSRCEVVLDSKRDLPITLAFNTKILKPVIIFSPMKLYSVPDDDFAIMFEHEILHIILNHQVPKNCIDPELFHIVCDFFINAEIPGLLNRYDEFFDQVRPSKSILAKACLPIYHTLLYHALIQTDKGAAAFYDELLSYPDVVQTLKDRLKPWDGFHSNATNLLELFEKRLKGDDSDGGYMHGDEEGDPCVGLGELNEALTSSLRSVLTESWRTTGTQQPDHISWGYIPKKVAQTVMELLESETDYNKLISRFATQLLKSESRKTWSRPNRRYGISAAARLKERKPKVLVIIDTSGSMNRNKIKEMILGDIKALLGCCEELHVVVGDTQETFRANLNKMTFNIEKVKFLGGGGTDLQFGWDAAKQLEVDGVVCNTDGEIPIPNTFGIPSLAMIYYNPRVNLPKKIEVLHRGLYGL